MGYSSNDPIASLLRCASVLPQRPSLPHMTHSLEKLLCSSTSDSGTDNVMLEGIINMGNQICSRGAGLASAGKSLMHHGC